MGIKPPITTQNLFNSHLLQTLMRIYQYGTSQNIKIPCLFKKNNSNSDSQTFQLFPLSLSPHLGLVLLCVCTCGCKDSVIGYRDRCLKERKIYNILYLERAFMLLHLQLIPSCLITGTAGTPKHPFCTHF